MDALQEKIDLALNEGRILLLGLQVLIGAQFLTIFASGFAGLPTLSRYLVLATLLPLALAFAVLLIPVSYHRLVEHGEDDASLHRLTTRCVWVALLPLALALGLDIYVALAKLAPGWPALGGALLTLLLAVLAWYGLEMWQRAKGAGARARKEALRNGAARPAGSGQGKGGGDTPLQTKIRHVLTEARMVLPGVQALLGFQFSNMFSSAFDDLPLTSRWVHLLSLGASVIAIILLIMPSAYHRIVLEGEQSERFHDLASRMVLWAMVPLALGIAGDMYVVTLIVSASPALALAAALLLLALCYGLWFGLTMLIRGRRRPA